MSKKRRCLNKLEILDSDEVSIVGRAANKKNGFDIIKSENNLLNEFNIIKQDFFEQYDIRLSENLWYAFVNTITSIFNSISWQDKTKEEKIIEMANLFNIFISDVSNNPFMKSIENEISIIKAKMKTEAGKKYPASSYLYAPDLEKPSTWKLRIYDENGILDKNLLSAAIASFSSGGFRGNKVQLPELDAKKIKTKLRNLWIETYPNKDESEIPERIKKENTNLEKNVDKQEKKMEKEEKVSKLQNLLDGVVSLFKGEEKQLEPAEVKKEVETKSLQKEEVKSEDFIKAELDLKKAQEEVLELKKQIEQKELEKKEQVEKNEKENLLTVLKSDLSFLEGTPEENVEKVFEIKKTISKENYQWLFENLKKKSEKNEEQLKEIGKSNYEAEDLTASQKLEKIAKQIETEQSISYEKAYAKAMDLNKELAVIAIQECVN